MKLVKLKCPSCGSNLEINKELKAFTCNYCGTTTMVDDEIIKVEHRIVGTKKKERIEALEALVDDKRYDVALKKAEKLSEDYPQESRIWLALLRTLTEDFTRKFSNADYYLMTRKTKWTWEKVFDFYTKYEKDKNKLREINMLYDSFKHKYFLEKYESSDEFKTKKRKEEKRKDFKLKTLVSLCVCLIVFGTIIIEDYLMVSIAMYITVIMIIYLSIILKK